MHSNTLSLKSTQPPDRRQEFGNDTIVALATAPGRGGIGIIRLSGPGVPDIAVQLIGKLPPPRSAHLSNFLGQDGVVIDHGIALYFNQHHSYTGEPVLELQGHGSPVVAQMMIRRCLELGARMARPGEFSERAFLSGQLDLAQAEAVADLIESSTESAARSAINTLQGEFSNRIHELVDNLTGLRIFVEAAIDFPEEEIDFLAEQQVVHKLTLLQQQFSDLERSVGQGKLLRDGLRVVLSGAPNAGKSSLLNLLCREQRAIVSDIPGTTRDVLEQHLELEGLPIVLIDTAGIRESRNVIEVEGVRRAREAQKRADLVLLVVDHSACPDQTVASLQKELVDIPTLMGFNKIDLSGHSAGTNGNEVFLSVLTGEGLPGLIESLKQAAGFREPDGSQFIARQRHIDALERARRHLDQGVEQLSQFQAGELLAEELRLAQKALGEITGAVSSDDLLGLIFSSFCIGK